MNVSRGSAKEQLHAAKIRWKQGAGQLVVPGWLGLSGTLPLDDFVNKSVAPRAGTGIGNY